MFVESWSKWQKLRELVQQVTSSFTAKLPLIKKLEHYKYPFERTYLYTTSESEEWEPEAYKIICKYRAKNSEKDVVTEVSRLIHGPNQLHTDYTLVLPCGHNSHSLMNDIPPHHEETYHRTTCMGREHLVECTCTEQPERGLDLDECSQLKVWRELCGPTCPNYKAVSIVAICFVL